MTRSPKIVFRGWLCSAGKLSTMRAHHRAARIERRGGADLEAVDRVAGEVPQRDHGFFRENLRMEDVKSFGLRAILRQGYPGLHAGRLNLLLRGTRHGPDVDAHELAGGVENEGLHLLRPEQIRGAAQIPAPLGPKHQMPEPEPRSEPEGIGTNPLLLPVRH